MLEEGPADATRADDRRHYPADQEPFGVVDCGQTAARPSPEQRFTHPGTPHRHRFE